MRIREATPDDVPGIARVHVDTWRTAYVDIVPAGAPGRTVLRAARGVLALHL